MTEHQRPLVQRFYKQVYRKSKIKADDKVWVASVAEQPLRIAAALRLQKIAQANHSKEALFLTGLAVHPEQRSLKPKLGYQLMSACFENESKGQGVLCFVASELLNYYVNFGFQPAPIAQLPETLVQRLARYNGITPSEYLQWKQRPLDKSAKLLPLHYERRCEECY